MDRKKLRWSALRAGDHVIVVCRSLEVHTAVLRELSPESATLLGRCEEAFALLIRELEHEMEILCMRRWYD